MGRTTASELASALHERGFKVGTERKWASGTVIKTAKGWIDRATGKPATPGGEPGPAVKVKGAVVAKSADVIGKAKAAVAQAPHVSKDLLAKLSGLPEAAKKLATDRDYRSNMGRQMAAALRRKTTHAIKSAVSEVHELKDAGSALKKIALRQKLSSHDKHALKGAAKVIGTTIAGTIVIGGIGHLTAAAIGTHFVAETLLKSTIRAALFAHLSLRGWPIYESDDAAVEEVVERVIELVLLKLEGLGELSDDDMADILESARENGDDEGKDDSKSEGGGGVKLSGERDWAQGRKHNRHVPDDMPNGGAA